MNPAQYHILKETSQTIGELLKAQYKQVGYKRVHLVVAAPKQENIEGKLPAVSIYLYNVTLDEEGIASNRSERSIHRVMNTDGTTREGWGLFEHGALGRHAERVGLEGHVGREFALALRSAVEADGAVEVFVAAVVGKLGGRVTRFGHRAGVELAGAVRGADV